MPKLKDMRLCPECNEVFESNITGVCPSCTNRETILLDRFFSKKEVIK